METYGHTGFTGTSVWTDPEKDLSIILLSNRTWPTRENGKRISEIRRKVANIVVQSMVEQSWQEYWLSEFQREMDGLPSSVPVNLTR
jgi:CubicO group peptidase (beta-lactamase class C family)